MKDKDGNIPSTEIEYCRGLESKVKSPSGKVTDTFGTLLKGNQLFKKGKYSKGYSLIPKGEKKVEK